jgi:hypothetical protein
MQFADVFVDKIDQTEISYSVRDRISGVLVEPRRSTKFIVNEADGNVHFDSRFISIPHFQKIYQTLA